MASLAETYFAENLFAMFQPVQPNVQIIKGLSPRALSSALVSVGDFQVLFELLKLSEASEQHGKIMLFRLNIPQTEYSRYCAELMLFERLIGEGEVLSVRVVQRGTGAMVTAAHEFFNTADRHSDMRIACKVGDKWLEGNEPMAVFARSTWAQVGSQVLAFGGDCGDLASRAQ